jgi:predicted O-methyltransferase YrrM
MGFIHGQILMDIISNHKPKKFLEIGVFTGVTARNICNLLNEVHGKNFEYYGLDLFEDYSVTYDNEVAPNLIRKQKQKFSNPIKHIYYNIILNEQINSLKSVEKFLKKYSSNIKLIKGDSKNTLKQINLSDIDMCFVDGGHSFETVYFELNYLLEHTKKGCLILCDDYVHHEAKGVKQAVDKVITEKNLRLEEFSNRFAKIVR